MGLLLGASLGYMLPEGRSLGLEDGALLGSSVGSHSQLSLLRKKQVSGVSIGLCNRQNSLCCKDDTYKV